MKKQEHTPMSKFDKLVAETKASSFFLFEKDKQARGPRRHKFVQRAESLTQVQLETLIELLETRASLCTVHGETYAVRCTDLGYVMKSTGPAAAEHTVSRDFSACSCPDYRFRNHTCKHMEAVSTLFKTC